jgi:hypothetical protein
MSLTARTAAGETVSSVMTAGKKGELVVMKKAEAGMLLHYLRPGTTNPVDSCISRKLLS